MKLSKYLMLLSLPVALFGLSVQAETGAIDAAETRSHCCVAQEGNHDHKAHHDDMMESGHCADRSPGAKQETEAADQEQEATGTKNQRQTRPSNVNRKHHHRR